MSSDGLDMWVNPQNRTGSTVGSRGATLKNGRDVKKVVQYSEFGKADVGEIKNRTLRFSSYRREPGNEKDDFSHRESTWFIEDEEIERLIAFLGAEVEKSGRYRFIDASSPHSYMLDLLSSGADASTLIDILTSGGDLGQLTDALSSSEAGLNAAESAVLSQRRSLVAELVALARDPSATETELHRKIGESYWIFGGRYVACAGRRSLTFLDEFDIPLVTADGSLHIVELKGPVLGSLVHKYRNHYIVGTGVHEAVGQAMNYLRSIDEQGATLQTALRNELSLDYDLRRVFATVVIGHPHHVRSADKHQVIQALRTYNSHLSRVNVVTYEELFDTAERSLHFH